MPQVLKLNSLLEVPNQIPEKLCVVVPQVFAADLIDGTIVQVYIQTVFFLK